MTDALALGEKLLSLLEESSRTSTYKSALLLALIDRAQEYAESDGVAVRALAERVVELYWPQTLTYPTTGTVLRQNNTGQAAIISTIVRFRQEHSVASRALPDAMRQHHGWPALVDRVEATLAEWPIPRLQHPFAPFLYDFDWSWQEAGGWSLRSYRNSSRVITLHAGVATALSSLGPLLRPFITRWWTDKAAQLNPDVEAALTVLEFEEFLFGRDRVALKQVAEGLLDLQRGSCFYCHRGIGARREVDHFIPWSHSGDDGLDNLVAACQRCNNGKRAALAGPLHLAELIDRNRAFARDLHALADERRWPRDAHRSARIARIAYLRSPDERPLWIGTSHGGRFENLGAHRQTLTELLG